MKIKQKNRKKLNIHLINIFLKFYFIFSIIFVILFSLIFFNTGYWNNSKDQFLSRLYTSSMINYIHMPEIIYKKIKSNFYKIPKLNINISFENQLNLENQRERRLENFGFSEEGSAFTEVNATIDFENNTLQTDLRLKGDRKSHWFEKDRASYKLDLKSNKDKIFGMRKFSLQKPRTRNYLHEWLFFELLGEFNLIKLNYVFVNLSINGSEPQLYALEESFDKILVERNKKRNGPIFSLHEEFTREHDSNKFEVYNKNFWLNDENIRFTQIAKTKLEDFLKNKNKDLKMFDTEKWANFFAITDLNYYPHARAAKSVKFFYNPIPGVFEPIGYDAHRSVPNFNKHIKNWYNLPIQNSFQDALRCKEDLETCIKTGGRLTGNYLVYKFFFKSSGELNEDFFKKYREAVYKITSKKFLDDFFKKKADEITKINSLIYGDYFLVDHNYFYGPGLYYFSKGDIYHRADILRKFFQVNIEKLFVEQKNLEILITSKEINNLELIVNKIECENPVSKIKYDYELNYSLKKGITLINNIFNKKNLPLKCTTVHFLDNEKNFYTKRIVQRLSESIDSFNFLNNDLFKIYFDIIGYKLFLKKDNTIIKENIYIPPGYHVIIKSGQKINLLNNAFIFSESSWNANGFSEEITIHGNKDNFGGGIYISDKSKPSYFENVVFKFLNGLKKPYFIKKNKNYFSTITSYNEKKINSFIETIELNPDKKILHNLNFNLMGSVNFFENEVTIKNVKFLKICSEDALNIISSKFLIIDSYFSENCSDSVDVDFGTGEIKNSRFENIGNDAIDFSGSEAILNSILLRNAGDKFISIGESSKINIFDLNGDNSFVGIVSKDGSYAKLQNIDLKNVKIALAAYIKKSEFDKGTIVGNNIKVSKEAIGTLTDKKSDIILNGTKEKRKTENIIQIIYNKNLNYIK